MAERRIKREAERTEEELAQLQRRRIWADVKGPIGRVFEPGELVPESVWKPVKASGFPWEKKLSKQLGERQG